MVFSEHPLQRALVGSFVGVCILCIGLYHGVPEVLIWISVILVVWILRKREMKKEQQMILTVSLLHLNYTTTKFYQTEPYFTISLNSASYWILLSNST